MFKFSARGWFFGGFIACILMLSTGAFFQFIMALEPCPLCISQRLAILLVGLVFLVAALHNPLAKGLKIYAILGTMAALIGAGLSIRHLWIQNMPEEEVPECGPGLSYIFENFPLINTLKLMLSGTGECAEVLWTFLGISIPGWTLVAFLFLGAMSLWQYSNHKGFSS
jgi:disulfide bond formation protein DsbB